MASSPPSKKSRPARRGLKERLDAGESIICAEGYLLNFCQQGYVAKGAWVPEFVTEHSDVLRSLHEQFVHAGTDVTEAYQYYTHRKGLDSVGKGDEVETINRTALRIAREIAERSGTLFAGGVSACTTFTNNELATPEVKEEIRATFEEQVRWSKEEGVDYVIAETLPTFAESAIALDVIKSFGLPAVITLVVSVYHRNSEGNLVTLDNIPIAEACKRLLDSGATLVGVNCMRGPETIIEVVEEIITKVPPEKVCALPVCYRTTKDQPTWLQLKDEVVPQNNPVYPQGIDAFHVSEMEIVKFTKRCMELGLKYIGLCCGNTGSYTRAMAETLGRSPPACKYRNPAHLKRMQQVRQQRQQKCLDRGIKVDTVG